MYLRDITVNEDAFTVKSSCHIASSHAKVLGELADCDFKRGSAIELLEPIWEPVIQTRSGQGIAEVLPCNEANGIFSRQDGKRPRQAR